MAYQNNRNNRNKNRNSERSMNYEQENYVPHHDSRPPATDGSGNYNPTIEAKVMKGLFQSSYSVTVDPYTEANNPSTPYSFLSSFNRILGGRFGGVKNLGGGNLIQYNNSVNTGFLKVFDTALIGIGLNYRYLPILASDTARGNLMIDEMRKAISEVTSSLSATSFYQQNIQYYAIDTDLPMGSATKTNVSVTQPSGSTTEVPMYTNIADVIYAYCMEYQLFLQNTILAFNYFNSNRAYMGTMIRMSWQREVPILNSYFGLMKKKSFLALFDSIAMNVAGEYVDQEWMAQANTICMAKSRRSNCINDPLLEVVGFHNMPTKFKAHICTSTEKTASAGIVFDQDDLAYTPPGQTTPITFQEAVENLCLNLSVTGTLKWARTRSTDQVNETDRFNQIKTQLDVITYCMTYFKTTVSDLRTVLNIMSNMQIVKWTLGTRLKVIKDTDIIVTNYLVVNNVYELAIGGAPSAQFDPITKRWRTFDLWNMYYGVPEHAEYSGGAFLTFSTKQLLVPSGTNDNNIGYLPVGFRLMEINGAPCQAINRMGTMLSIDTNDVTMAGDKIFSRLVPLASQSALKLRVPTASTLTDPVEQAFAYRFLLQVFGLGSVGGDEGIDPDTIAVYEYEIEDFTNEVISYCRAKGPFRVAEYMPNSLGFFGVAEDKK